MGQVIADEPSCKEVAVKLSARYGGTSNELDSPAGCFRIIGASVFFNSYVDPSSTFPSSAPSYTADAGICITPGISVNHLLV